MVLRLPQRWWDILKMVSNKEEMDSCSMKSDNLEVENTEKKMDYLCYNVS
jgi:hypothetical protein